MSNRYLDEYQKIISAAQRKALESILRKGNVPEEELSKSIADILGFADDAPISTLEPIGDKISHSHWNEFQKRIIVDISAAYEQAKNTKELLQTVLRRNQSLYARLLARLDQISQRLFALADKAPDFGGKYGISWEFMEDDSESDPDLMHLYEGKRKAKIGTDEGLVLSPTLDIQQGRQGGFPTIKAEVANQLGKSAGLLPTAIENCLDANPNTFWMDVVLSDAPLSLTEYKSSIDWLSDTEYESGAAVRLKFSFPHPVAISEIVLTPIAPFPINVLKVEYYGYETTPDLKKANYTEHATRTNRILSITAKDSAPLIQADTIFITINQPHYTANPYSTEKGNLTSQKYLEEVANQEFELTVGHSKESQLSYWDEKVENPYVTDQYIKTTEEWGLWLSELYKEIPEGEEELLKLAKQLGGVLLRLIGNLFILKGLRQNSDLVQTNKFEYVYGLREVEFRYREYSLGSRYVSPTLEIDGEPREATFLAALDVDDDDTVNAYLLLNDNLSSKVALPINTTTNINIGSDISPTWITDEFIATKEDGKLNLFSWPYVDYSGIHTYTLENYPTTEYNANVESTYDSTIVYPPIRIVIITPSGQIIPYDTTGEDFRKEGTPVQQSNNAAAVLTPMIAQDVQALYDDVSLARGLSDIGFRSLYAIEDSTRQFFKSAHTKWIAGTTFILLVVSGGVEYEVGASTGNYIARSDFPQVEVLYDTGLIVLRNPIPSLIPANGGAVSLDLSGANLQLKAYNYYYEQIDASSYRPVPFTQNKSDYMRGYSPQMMEIPFNNDFNSPAYYPVFAYIHQGRTIQLNRVFTEDEGYLIRISYRTLNISPRLIMDITRGPSLFTTTPYASQQTSPRVSRASLLLGVIK